VPRALSDVVHAHARGERSAGRLRHLALERLSPAATSIDYLSLADADDLSPLADTDEVGERALVATAAFIGKTRLIDNVVLGEDRAPRPEEP
jgi:pantoate--beta-alanine ligase